MSSNPIRSEPLKYPEIIGDQQYLLEHADLDVFTQVSLWNENPRIQVMQGITADIPTGEMNGTPVTESECEERLRISPGYDALKSDIRRRGQLTPIYVFKQAGDDGYTVFEGATRVTVLRELALSLKGKPEYDRYSRVKCKVIPPHAPEKDLMLLVAQIHVRGDGVRQWARFNQAKFIYEKTEGNPPLFSVDNLSQQLGKTHSWGYRLKNAYKFALLFIDHIDTPEAKGAAAKQFSTLEEISKATGFGKKVRADGSDGDELREEVFKMVNDNVFKEYRDARFMADFHANPEMWERLKSGEEHVANKLAKEISSGQSSVASRILGLPKQIENGLKSKPESVTEEHFNSLNESLRLVAAHLSGGLNTLRIGMNDFTEQAENAPLVHVKEVEMNEINRLKVAVEDLEHRKNRAQQTAQELSVDGSPD